jgi:hypothetical protein
VFELLGAERPQTAPARKGHQSSQYVAERWLKDTLEFPERIGEGWIGWLRRRKADSQERVKP